MIFLEATLKKGEYRSLAADVESRVFGCGRDEGGKFAPQNQCQDDGQGGGGQVASSTPPARDDSWKESDDDKSWSRGDLEKASPIAGGEKLSSMTVRAPGIVADAIRGLGLPDLDSLVSIGGGAVRDGSVEVAPYDEDELSVRVAVPVDPDKPDGARATWHVTVSRDGYGTYVDYGGFYTDMEVSDPKRGGVSRAARLRVASVVRQRLLESMMAAEASGVAKAHMVAAGDSEDPHVQGYRVWPQFGFDAPLRVNDIPDEIVLQAAGIAIPPPGSTRVPQQTVLKGLRRQVTKLTVQQLISTREGKRWWDENGKDIELSFNFKDKNSPGYKRFKEAQQQLPRLRERNENRSLLWWLFESMLVESRDCGPSDKDESGRFGPGNDCQKDAGDGVAQEAKAAKSRNVDVMLGGGKRVAVMDEESRARAIADFKANPKPEGSAPGSTTDIWDRTFVTRAQGRPQKSGTVSEGKIDSTDPIFSADDLRQNGQFVAHEAVGLYLSNRHEEARRATGAEGPGSIIDIRADEVPEAQMQYLVDSLTEDALHAYDVLGVDPGFYSTDLGETMRLMTQRHPEFETDENAKFVFTALLAITSSGQGPDSNLRDADDLYRMFREHGTVVPDGYGGGARDAVASLQTFQALIDSFGLDRTRRLMSGYTTAGKVEETFARLAGRSQAQDWRERTGASAWALPVDSKGKRKDMVSGELKDEVTPVASIFGPKIGSFFANLTGRHDFLTMDRWLMRSVGRVSGDLITRATPEQAKGRANEILKALEGGKWSRAKLFGVDKSHGITKADLVRSLKIQARTGVIEENGAAFIWATAAERSYGKTPRIRAGGGKPGGYGKHEDPEIHALHERGNSMFKSLIHEQQDPGTGTGRRNIREVFRRVQAEIEKKTGRKADIDEIQAALWQYEKRLWKHLGAKTNITDNSLFSAAAEGVLSGRLARSEDHPTLKPFRPAARRDYQPTDDENDLDDDFDVNHFDVEQSAWNSDFAALGIDILEVLKMLEEDVEERSNFAALDAVIESRSADCGRDDGGRFGLKNQCQEEGGGSKEKNKTATEKSKAIAGPIAASDPRIKDYRKPFTPTASPNSDFVSVPGDDEVKAALSSDKQAKFGRNRDLDEGYPVDLRIDIPAFERKGVYAVTVHEHTGTSRVGSPIGYDSVVRLGGEVSFSADNETLATSIMFGRDKTPLATVKGKFTKSREIPADINSWTPVGYDPKKATFFYDKKTGEEITGGTDAISVGNSVFVRLPKKGKRNAKNDYRDSGGFWGLESRDADCGRGDGGKFGEGNTCAKGGVTNSGGEHLRGVRRRGDKQQTKVGRKLFQMRLPEKNLKSLVRALGGKVQNTLVEINSGKGEEGINVFVRDRDNNETHFLHIGYYGATIYPTDRASAQDTSRIQEAAKEFLPQTIDDRLWLGGRKYPIYVVNDPEKAKEQWGGLSAKQRLKKEQRDADCGRQEGGKFGPGNKCQDEGDGASFFDSNANSSWTPASGSEPFEGASRYSEVRASGAAQVEDSLERTGLSPGEALAATGAPERSDVWMRPAPEFAREFPGSDAPPVLVTFDSDVAGIRRGLSGSSVIGSFKNEETGETERAIYHSVFEVLPAVQEDPAKRHAAAREFYRTMVSSIEAARKKGIAEIKFSAAGRGDDSAADKTAFRGYTIWPRMGFDAALPERIRAKLPESLSHAKSLLDLHATREGTKWWADNGEDIDVSLRIADRSSPQNQIVDRFIKHFMKQRRSMPLGTGDDWLSPEDLLRLDEMWQEVWDEGDLDDYEFVEKRSADCGRTDDGRFGPRNECQKDAAQGEKPQSSVPLSPAASQIKKLAAKGVSRKELQAAIEKAIVGKSGWLGGYTPGEASPSEVCRALGISVANEGELDELIGKSWGYERQGIAAAIAQLAAAKRADAEGIKGSTIRIDTAKSAAEWLGVGASEFHGTFGCYIAAVDTISIIAGSEDDADHLKRLGEMGYDSTPHEAHTVIHETAHRSHYQEIERRTGIGRPPEGSAVKEWEEHSQQINDRVFASLQEEYRGDYDWALRVSRKIEKVSYYATTDPFEAVAEYSTAVRLGYRKNDPDLDRFCRATFAPIPRRTPR